MCACEVLGANFQNERSCYNSAFAKRDAPNQTELLQQVDIGRIYQPEILNYEFLRFDETRKDSLAAIRQGINLRSNNSANLALSDFGIDKFYWGSQKEIKSIQKLNYDSSNIAERASNNGGDAICHNFYKFNVSFEEINDFKIGLHILLFILIGYFAKKTYDL